ncbi:MAG TPA: ABC transporter ATP-binding protein [Arthrobacter sp.]|nr:ABC transporter ATP-binding protein [Arthrobacter sp.]
MKVTLENIDLKYGDTYAVKGVNAEIEDGQSLVLLGKSGCGKTSTMRCIAGLETPVRGRITIGDQVVFDSEKNINVPSHKRNVGMVFQSYAVWPHRTIFENVAFPLQMKKLGKKEITERVDEALNLVGLDGFQSRGASLLSGGQMQRVALARSLVMRPSVLLLDEPLSNLDARLRDRLRIELRALQQKLNLTCVYVTHDQGEALALADRIALMQNGKLAQVGSPGEIYENPASASIADFLGVTNIFAVHKNGHPGTYKMADHRLELATADYSAGGDAIKACIRPEDVIVSTERPTEEQNNWSGEVKVASYQGSNVRYLIELDGGPSIEALVARRDCPPAGTGNQVWVTASPSDIQILPAEVA